MQGQRLPIPIALFSKLLLPPHLCARFLVSKYKRYAKLATSTSGDPGPDSEPCKKITSNLPAGRDMFGLFNSGYARGIDEIYA
jgi:hypothetical protein